MPSFHMKDLSIYLPLSYFFSASLTFFHPQLQNRDSISYCTHFSHSQETQITIIMSSWPMAGSEFVEGLYTLSSRQLPQYERECNLCQIQYDSSAGGREVSIRLPCGHSFGDACIYNYMSEDYGNNNRCPTCGAVAYRKLYRYLKLCDLIKSEEYQEYQEHENGHEGTDEQDEHAHSPTESEVNDALEHELRLAREYDESQRGEIAANRRIGSLSDHATYQKLLADGADLPPLAATDLLLNRAQDRALFEEFQRRGAFARSGASTQQYENHSDYEIYEKFRDRGLGWSPEHEKWVCN